MQELERDLIRRFRDKINDNHHFVLHKYRNMNGKNLWNVICSAMDWIEVAVEGIPYIQLGNKNENVASLNLMQLICAMDLVTESTRQLYRVFELPYPYHNDHCIFGNEKTDDTYFKHVRAMFGVHPVNLTGENDERYYASWSTPKLEADFSVFVYSNQPDKESQIHSIFIKDLFEYTIKRYSLLNDLIEHVEHDYQTHLINWKGNLILGYSATLDQIDILLHENEQRFGIGEAYWFQLEELKKLFEIDDTVYDVRHRVTVLAYKDELKIVLNEIQHNLQYMNIEELKNYEILYSFESIPFSYNKEKLLTYLRDPDSDFNARILADYALRAMVQMGVFPKEALDYERDELLLYLSAWQWDQNKRRGIAEKNGRR